VLVYAKVKETYHPKPAYADHRFVYPSGAVLEYLFVLTASKEGYKISRVLPFHYVAPDGRLRKVEFPGDLKLYQNIETWPGDFEVEEIMLDEFLASQAGQRMQGIFSQDKKILEQFDEIKAGFSYFPPYRLKEAVPALAKLAEGKPREFRCRLELKPKENLVRPEGGELLEDPRISYALSVTLGEFAEIMHGYGFKDYESLKIEIVAPGETAVFEIARPLVEKFYKKRIALKDILKPVSASAEASVPEPNSG